MYNCTLLFCTQASLMLLLISDNQLFAWSNLQRILALNPSASKLRRRCICGIYVDEDKPNFIHLHLLAQEYTINYWIELGADRKKLVLGMPMYGQAFTLDKPSVNGLNAPAGQKGEAGEFTRAAGFLAYYEICNDIKNRGFTVVKDAKGRMGPYAFKDRQWVSFDDVDMIKYKVRSDFLFRVTNDNDSRTFYR